MKQLEDDEASEYIKNYCSYFRISNHFLELYTLKDDVDFWKTIALGNRNENNDSRLMKVKIIARIKERNNNKYDTFLGMGYTINFEDLERDYVYQYYLFGIFGIILIIPQMLLFIKTAFYGLKNIKKFDFTKTLLVLMAPSLGFVVAYYSGHVFGWISPSYILVLTLAFLYFECQIGKKIILCEK